MLIHNNQNLRLRINIFLLFSLLFLNNIPGQDYVPFPTKHVTWKNLAYDGNCPDPGLPCYVQILYVNGEINLNGKVYSRLYVYDDDNGTIISGYKGAYRNEYSTKKVYFVRYDETEEKLLYDFDMLQGDTVVAVRDTAQCLSIDSIIIDGNYRKRYLMRSIIDDGVFRYDYHIIEGIGSTNGLMYAPNTNGFESGSHWLVCYAVGGNVVYNPSDYPCDELTPIGNTESEENWKILPNPTSDYFSIDQPGYPITIQVISLAGELVLTRQYTHHDKIMVPVGDLAPGTYLVRLITSDQVSVQKLSVVK